MIILKILFWFFLIEVFYTFFGYGIILWIMVRIKELFHPVTTPPVTEEYPEVTLLIAAYNEQDYIAEKMVNCRALKYPSDKLHFVWVTDGSNDRTPDLLREYPENTVLHEDARRGKSAALNRAMEFVTTPLVIMTDANTILNPECIYNMIRKFDDPKVGCVCGEKRVISEGESAAGTEGFYWKYECTLKKLDDRLYSTMGAVGELIAIRRELWLPIEPDVLVDDMILSMGIVRRGYKIAYCDTAFASEKPSADIAEERKRKIRLSAGGFQATHRLRDLLNPFKYGIVAFQFLSHRVLRWVLTPSAMLLLLPVNIAIVCLGASKFYLVILILQILFYLAALAGFAADKKGHKSIFHIPYYFLFANMSTFAGLKYYLHYNGNAAWEKAKRA